MLVDAQSNTAPGPIEHTFSPASVRYIRLTVTGADNYSGDWVSIRELEVFTSGGGSGGVTNLATSGSISGQSAQNAPYVAANAIDGIDNSDNNRWSAEFYPQWIEIDLGSDRTISETELVSIQGRAYQFTVEARPASGTYTTVVNRSGNTTNSPISDTFSPVTARYVRLTVTGASGYSGDWVSIREFKVFGN